MEKQYKGIRRSLRHNNKFTAIATFVIVCIFCSGCLRPPSTNSIKSNGVTSSERILHPVDYYEGYWFCNGYGNGRETVAFNDLSLKERDSFPFFILDLGKNGGTLAQVNNGNGEYRPLFGGDIHATDERVGLINENDALELTRVDDALVLLPEAAASLKVSVNKMGLYPDYRLPQGDVYYYFTRLASDSRPQVTTFEFEGITLDIPADVAYMLYSKVLDRGDDGNVSIHGASYRRYGPQMDFSSWPTAASSIVEAITESEGQNYCAEHAGEFTEQGGVLYHLHHNENLNYSRLGFVADGKLYEIVLHYDNEDIVDYSDYRKQFFKTIRLVGKEDVAKHSDVIPPGALPWQEASKHVGETVAVYGSVADIEYASTSNGQPTFIDLGAAYPDTNRVTIVIWGEDKKAFPESPEEMYHNKNLCVTGKIYMHEGVCNIKVVSPSQVQFI